MRYKTCTLGFFLLVVNGAPFRERIAAYLSILCHTLSVGNDTLLALYFRLERNVVSLVSIDSCHDISAGE